MENEERRDFLAEAISCARRALRKKPVKSNQELRQRIDEYFEEVQGRRIPPTVEEFSLYLGYSVSHVMDFRNETIAGFPDESEGSTASILKKSVDVLHNIDALQSMHRMTDGTTYIFRSKNYYDMKDKSEPSITVNLATPAALPPEEIAKMLPELTPDRSMDDVDII